MSVYLWLCLGWTSGAERSNRCTPRYVKINKGKLNVSHKRTKNCSRDARIASSFMLLLFWALSTRSSKRAQQGQVRAADPENAQQLLGQFLRRGGLQHQPDVEHQLLGGAL